MQASESFIAPPGRLQPWRYLYRLPLLVAYVAVAFPLLLVALLPGLRGREVGGQRLACVVQRQVSRGLVRVLGMQLTVHGALPEGPFLLVANHISWFDIPLLHALSPLWLVAKADIRGWPLVGAMAAAVGTIFIARGSDASRRQAARRMVALLRKGHFVGLFPEAGIAPERGVKTFHARLFAAAQRAPAPVLPVAIRYWRDGDIHDERVFGPGTGFFGLLISMLGRAPCEGQLLIGTAIEPAGRTRRELAALARQQILELYAHVTPR